MNDYFFQNVWRMDWGFGNPNKTAALIATLLVGVWALPWLWRKGFWVSLLLSVGLAICLVHTMSRGGLIAAGVGLAVLAFFAARPWPRANQVALVVAFWAVVAFAIHLKAHERYGKGVLSEDRSISNRLEIWKSGPSMMVDAPGGWGFGNAGEAYMQWYQPVNRTEEYRTLVNSHLTWMVEMGWIGRFGYLLAWCLVFWICWPGSVRSLAVPFACWLAFGIAAFFSSVAESPWIWGVPTLALLSALVVRFRLRSWPDPRSVAIPVMTTLLVIGGIVIGGRDERDLKCRDGGVVIGDGTSGTWLVAGERAIGRHYGRQLRTAIPGLGKTGSGAESLTVVRQLQELVDDCPKRLVIAGQIPRQDFEHLKKVVPGLEQLIVLSPDYFPQELGLGSGVGPRRVESAFGEFSQSPAINAWSELGKVQTVEGSGDYLPGWAEIVSEWVQSNVNGLSSK